MKKVFNQLMSGLDDVEAFLQGKKEGFQVHAPEEVDVKHIRKCLNLTQEKFSDIFGFSLDSIKNWETGRRKPEAAARTLLVVIHKNPVGGPLRYLSGWRGLYRIRHRKEGLEEGSERENPRTRTLTLKARLLSGGARQPVRALSVYTSLIGSIIRAPSHGTPSTHAPPPRSASH